MKLFLICLCFVICNGDFNDGRYYHDNSGRYIPDNSGQYIPDYSGNYIDDGTGRYKDNIEKYRHQNDRYQGSGTNIRPIIQTTIKPIPKIDYANLYNANKEGRWRIIRQKTDVGQQIYQYDFETENKILAEEKGKIINKGTKNEGIAADGFYEYIGPDNVKYHVVYSAGEQGFQPFGAHIPTPPPIPEPILKALNLEKTRRF